MKNFTKFLGRNRGGALRLLLVVVGMVWGVEANATNYYIAPSGTGNDANNGTAVGTPKLTLGSIFSTYNLGSGDIIYVAAGTYTEKTITVGSDDEGFTIQGAALSSGTPTSIFDSDNTSVWMGISNLNCDNIIIDKLTIKDYQRGINVNADGVDGLTITSCLFNNCDAASSANGGGIYIWANGSTNNTYVTDCSFQNCDAPSGSGGAIAIVDGTMGGSTPMNFYITRCKFNSNSTAGVNNGSAIAMIGGNSGSTYSNLSITNSQFYGNTSNSVSQQGVIYTNARTILTMKNSTVYNNTGVAGSNTGIFACYIANIYNSIIYNNTGNDFYDGGSASTSMINCYFKTEYNTDVKTSCSTADPKVTSTTDMTLQSTSPCINAGTTTNSPPIDDYASNLRKGNPDIGCYEYTSGTCGTTYSTTYTIGTLASGGDWTTLTAALNAIKECISGHVILELDESYRTEQILNETYPISFYGLNTSSSATLTIRPKSNVTAVITMNGSSTTSLFDMNGTDYVTIDGRPGGSGTNKYITINNTNTTSGATAVNYYANATNNTIQYCTLKSTATGTTSGVVTFGTGSNSSNSISNCDIDGGAGATATPTNAARVGIYSTGTANDNISITNNNIYNCFNTTVTSPHAGIYVGNGSSAWTITGNSIYQTSNRTVTGNTDYYGIVISNTSSVGNTVSNNYVGGTSNSCGGTKFTFAGNYSNAFHGIYINVGTSSSTTVNGNTIANLSFTSSLAGNYFYGINVPAGNVNIGTTAGTGNTIGSRTADASVAANASITLIPTSASANNALGIYSIIAADHTVNYNRVAGINVSNSTATNPATFYGIYPAGTTANAPTVTYNSVGSNNNTNSIVVGTDVSAVNTFYGIVNQGYTGVVTMEYDTIQGVKVYGTGASMVYPIYNTTGATNSSISFNTIKNISNESAGTTGALFGIYNAAAPKISISSNTINAITCKNGYFRGIRDNVAATGIHTISLNTIGSSSVSNDISISSTSTTESMCINIGGSTGTYTISSNTIQNVSQSGAETKHLYGIQLASAGIYTVSSNTIDKLYNNTSGSYSSTVAGVYMLAIPDASSVIEKNKLTNFKNLNTNAPKIAGIYSTTATTLKAYNNYFECDNEGSSNNNTLELYGIYVQAANNNITAYHNTIYISGSVNSNSTQGSSYCLRNQDGAGTTLNIKNNILINTRTGGGGSAIQGVSWATPTNTTHDYNYYYNREQTYSSGGGTNSIYHQYGINTQPTINSDGSLSTSSTNWYSVVKRGVALAAVADDIAGNSRSSFGGFKGCYEGSSGTCNTTYSGTYTIGTGQTWTTLTAALTAIKECISGNVILELDETYRTTQEKNETYPINFFGLNTSSSATLTIRPKSNVTAAITMDSTSSTALFDFNGADYVTIDGRLGGSGSSNYLTLYNKTTSGNVIRLNEGATNNTIQYTNIKSAGTSTVATVLFGTSSSVGNSNNTIDNCVIFPNSVTQKYAIESTGSASYVNTSNTISNCEIKDFGTHGIYVNTNSSTWTISGNHIYQTSGLSVGSSASGTNIHALIYVATGGSYEINSNYLGGIGKFCAAGYLNISINATGTNVLYGVYYSSSASGTTYIRNNKIKYLACGEDAAGNIVSGITIDNVTNQTLYISNNNIYDIYSSGTTTTNTYYPSFITGIGTCSSLVLYINNNLMNYLNKSFTSGTVHKIIGIDLSTISSATSCYLFNNFLFYKKCVYSYGIRVGVASTIYNNTIATPGSGGNYSNYCLDISSNNCIIKNNIFQNTADNNSGHSENACINIGATSGHTHSYNSYQKGVTRGYYAVTGTSANDAGWGSETGLTNETAFVFQNDDGSATPTAKIFQKGTDLSSATPSISTDIAGNSRAATPTIGCFEINNNLTYYYSRYTAANSINRPAQTTSNWNNNRRGLVFPGTVIVSGSAGSNAVTGTNTEFLNDFRAGDVLGVTGSANTFTINTITNNLLMYHSSGNISATSNTYTNNSYTLSNPANFSTSGYSFIIQSGHQYKTTASWDATNTNTTGYVEVENGGALDLGGQTISNFSILNLSGDGVSSSGALFNTAASTFSLPIVLKSNTTIGGATGSGLLTLSGTGGITGTGYQLTINGSNDITLSTGLNTSTAGSLIKNGTGTFTLSGAGNYTGNTTINAGVINIQNATALGTTAGTVSVSNGTSLQMQGAVVGAKPLTLNGTGISSDGALRFISGTNSWAGAVTLGSATRINADAGTNTISGSITGTGLGLTIGGAGNLTLSGGINTSTSGTLTKDGAGILTISGTCNYTGSTILSNGTITLGVANALPVSATAGVIQTTSTSGVTLNLGLYDLGTSTASANSAGQLDLDVNTTIQLGTSGSNKYYFKASNGQTWNGSTITIDNWNGTAGSSNSSGRQIFIGSDGNGLTQSQLDKITFTNYTAGAMILSTGEIVPICVAPATPGAISGTTTQCPSLASQTYSISSVSGATSYTWTVPTGWSITAGGTTNSVTVTTGTASQNGNITVTATNSCGTSAAQTLAVTVNSLPTSVISGDQTICNGNTSSNISIALTGSQPWSLTYTDGTTPVSVTGIATSPYTFTVSPSSTKTYTVSALSDANCTANVSDKTGSATVTVNSLPTAVTVSGGSAICSGSSATLTASNSSSGTIYWQNTTSGGTNTTTASSSQSVSSAGTYYFRAQSAQGCWGTEGSATITVNALPTAVTVSGGGAICSGTSATLTASNSSSGTIYWQNTTSGGTSTTTASSSQSVSSAGTYYFRAQSAQGCWGTEGSATITVNANATYYVSTSGSNSNSGTTAGSPFATLQYAIDQVSGSCGATIYVASGTYTQDNITINNKSNITIIGAGIASTIFDGTQTNRFMSITGTSSNISISDMKIFEMFNVYEGGGMYITSSGTVNITSIHFDKCILKTDNVDGGLGGGAIYASSSSTVNVYKSKFTNNHDGYQNNSKDGASICNKGSMKIENCLFYNNRRCQDTKYDGDVTYTGANADGSIVNSTFIYNNNCTVPIYISDGASVTLLNSIVYGADGGYHLVTNNPGTVTSVNCIGNNGGTASGVTWGGTKTNCTTTTDFKFTNAASGDYTITSASPCVNYGTSSISSPVSLTAPSDDYAGVSRSGNPDVGCYEAPSPTITTSGTLTAFSACSGSTSSEQSFTISGVYLGADLVITPPTGFEISETSGTSFASSISIAPSSGTVSSRSIYVRSTTSASNGNGGNIVCSSTNATTKNVATGSLTVNALPTPTFTAQAGASACASSDVTYTTEATKTNYSWTVPGALNTDYSITSGGVGTSSNTVTLKWLTTGSKTVTINYTDGNGCTAASATSSTATTVNARPTISGTATVCMGSTTVLTGSGTAATSNAWSSSDVTKATINTTTTSGTVTPVAAGTTDITYTDNNGCTSTATTVTVYARPTISGTATVCIGSTRVLTGSGTAATSNAWSSSDVTKATINTTTTSGTVTPVAAGTTDITYTDNNGCTSTATTVTVYARPTISGTATVCIGSTRVLTGSGTAATSNAWSSSDVTKATINTTTTSGTVTPVAAGTTDITYTDNNGCTSTATTVTIYGLPTLTTTGTITAVTYNASAQTSSLTYTASTNSPTSYSIDWDATANTASLSDQSSTAHTFQAGGSSISDIAISAGVAAGSYSGTMTFTTAAGCSGTQAVSITINSGVTTFYFKGSGNMDNKASWTANSDGSTGTEPTAMNSNGCTFNIFHLGSNASPSLNGTWTLGTGSKIVVGNGTNAVNFTVPYTITGGQIDVSNNATLTITTTTNPTLGTLNSGSTIVYAGSSAQTLPASATIPKLIINNSNGVAISGNTTISGTLTLTAGKLTIPSSTTLTLGTTTTDITLNTGGATNYIVCTDTTAKIQRYLNANNTTYTFPMGDASSYNPMTLNFASGISGTDKYVTTSVKNTVAPGFVMANFSNYIKRYWLIYGNFTGVNYTITYKYNNSDVQILNTEHTLIPVKRSGATWYKPTEATNITNGTIQGSGSVDTTNNICTWSGLTSFSFDMAAGDEAQALPIHLLYFTAKPQTNRVRLDWATASETNNDYFTVERSQDGENFNELFKKPGAGISTTNLYYFGYDNKPLDGISYYRLKQTDYDGKFEYSDIESVNFTQGNSKEDIELNIYPNPVENNTIHVKFDAKQPAGFHISLYDAVGKLIYQETINAEKGPNDHAIELPGVAAGMYQLEIRNDELGVITRSIEF